MVQPDYIVLSFGKILTPILPFHPGVQIYSSKFSEKLKKLLEGRGGHGRKRSDRVTCDGIVLCLEQLGVFQDSTCNGNQDELCPAVMLNLYFNGYFNWQFFSIMSTDRSKSCQAVHPGFNPGLSTQPIATIPSQVLLQPQPHNLTLFNAANLQGKGTTPLTHIGFVTPNMQSAVLNHLSRQSQEQSGLSLQQNHFNQGTVTS